MAVASFDCFGETDPRKMPTHLFFGALHIDYGSAQRADVAKQDFSVCPRHWYVNATFRCKACDTKFVFSAEEQRFWYEERRFYVDSRPRQCPACRKQDRRMKLLKQRYDSLISKAVAGKDVGAKQAVVSLLDELASSSYPLTKRTAERRQLLLKQIKKQQAEGKR
ncbi:MAG TPA: zinc-ribbon domain containing protein [Planctomycetota bacterium]|jgi:hypothetical protein